MNKLKLMSQPDLPCLIRDCIRQEPGINCTRVFEAAKEWAGHGRLTGHGFDVALRQVLKDKSYRCTDKRLYRVGDVLSGKNKRAKLVDPRQVSMF